ncbi:MAG: TIGR02466 family protein [Alphaproteobacteria bacterium]
MALDIQLNSGLLLAFPTPILRLTVPDADAINGNLKKAILEKAKADDGTQRHNVGSWRSREDLLSWELAEIEVLKGAINKAIARLTQLSLGAKAKGMRGEVNVIAWANVCREGGYIKQHIHSLSNWSGVYFVSVEEAIEGKPESGLLEFVDPRPGVNILTTPGDPFGGTLKIRPAPGLLVMHPGWLAHYVNPYYGADERVSIAFNALVKGVTLQQDAQG